MPKTLDQLQREKEALEIKLRLKDDILKNFREALKKEKENKNQKGETK